jgi:nucleotide-binding universal stress UspA family protein
MPGAIAVAVDGSEASAAALAHALRLAGEADLLGVFVLDAGWADYIGNDWQSSRNARQDFLDYVRGHLERQAEEARRQFAAAVGSRPGAHFRVLAGDPLEELCRFMAGGEAATLVAGREVFQVCGRPSCKSLTRDLAKRIGGAVVVV